MDFSIREGDNRFADRDIASKSGSGLPFSTIQGGAHLVLATAVSRSRERLTGKETVDGEDVGKGSQPPYMVPNGSDVPPRDRACKRDFEPLFLERGKGFDSQPCESGSSFLFGQSEARPDTRPHPSRRK